MKKNVGGGGGIANNSLHFIIGHVYNYWDGVMVTSSFVP